MHPLCFCSVEYIKVLSYCKLEYSINTRAKIDCKIFRVMIIDLDAHQGNGHEMDFAYDSMSKKIFAQVFDFLSFSAFTNGDFVMAGRVYILDMYNPGIYPLVICSLICFT